MRWRLAAASSLAWLVEPQQVSLPPADAPNSAIFLGSVVVLTARHSAITSSSSAHSSGREHNFTHLAYRFAVSTGRAGSGQPIRIIRSVWQPHGFRSCTTIRQCLIRSSFTAAMPFTAAMRSPRLGGPASHGCIRLHPANAATLFELVKSEGMGAIAIVVSGGSPVLGSRPAPSRQPYAIIEIGHDPPITRCVVASGRSGVSGIRPLRH